MLAKTVKLSIEHPRAQLRSTTSTREPENATINATVMVSAPIGEGRILHEVAIDSRQWLGF